MSDGWCHPVDTVDTGPNADDDRHVSPFLEPRAGAPQRALRNRTPLASELDGRGRLSTTIHFQAIMTDRVLQRVDWDRSQRPLSRVTSPVTLPE